MIFSFIKDVFNRREEKKIYKGLGLKSAKIGGRKALIDPTIDWDGRKDPWRGRTNRERAKLGYPPIDKNNKPKELHHEGQDPKGRLVELPRDVHRGPGTSGILHPYNSKGSRFIGENNRGNWKKQQKQYWKNRADSLPPIEDVLDGVTDVLNGFCNLINKFNKK